MSLCSSSISVFDLAAALRSRSIRLRSAEVAKTSADMHVNAMNAAHLEFLHHAAAPLSAMRPLSSPTFHLTYNACLLCSNF